MRILDRLIVSTLPIVPRPIVGKISSRYVAGESLDQALETVRKLVAKGACTTLDVLGEFVKTKEEAGSAADEYIEALEAIDRDQLDSNVSVKLTHMGLLLDEEFCYENVRRIVERAKQLGNFVRIDMEDSPVTSSTLALYRRLREDYDNVGFVIQAYLRRSLDDLISMRDLKPSVRVCKGIYQERREIAYKDREIINRNFALLVEELLRNGGRVAIATHDERVVWDALRLLHELDVPKDRYEFQMLLGVDHQLRDILLAAGHRLRVYIPFGRAWYAYSMRRLKENPTIAWYVTKNLFKRT